MRLLKVSVILLTLMLLGLLSYIAPDGIPDSRIFGYAAAEIDAWAMDAQVVELARGPVHLIDTIFPLFLAASFCVLLPRGWLWLLPLGYLVADYAENTLLLAYYDGLSAAQPLSPWASPLTQVKWFFVLAGLVAIVRRGMRFAATKSKGLRP